MSDLQNQNTVTAFFKSKQLLHVGFVKRYCYATSDIWQYRQLWEACKDKQQQLST